MNVTIKIPQSAIERMVELGVPNDKMVDLYACYVLDCLGLTDQSWSEIMFYDWTINPKNIIHYAESD